jgi:hypothetical protein
MNHDFCARLAQEISFQIHAFPAVIEHSAVHVQVFFTLLQHDQGIVAGTFQLSLFGIGIHFMAPAKKDCSDFPVRASDEIELNEVQRDYPASGLVYSRI